MGYSLQEWLALRDSQATMNGYNGQIRPITVSELKRNNKVESAWIGLMAKYTI